MRNTQAGGGSGGGGSGGGAVGGHHPHMCVVAARSERFPRLGRKKAGKGQEGRKRQYDLPPPLPRRTP